MIRVVPPGSPLATSIESFDARVDTWLEQVRGNPLSDRLFNTASTLGDFSVLWHLISIGRAVAGKRNARQSIELSLFLGAESLIVNQGIKRLFKRTRPTTSGDERYGVRTPSTSSFPSGHASSAFFAATVLTSMTGKRRAPLWYGIAAIVSLSRPYVRIHHASDIVGGAAVGLTLGVVATRLRRLWTRPRLS
jgi:membrane-associated phospholipid phosphatase